MKLCRMIALVLACGLLLSACGGNVRHVVPVIGPSEVYESSDIEKAMDVVLDYFHREFEGCTMTRLEYDEMLVLRSQEEWAAQYDADQAIVLLSDFEVSSFGGDGSLNPGGAYINWQWILIRNADGDWKLRTWGFG